MLFGSGSGGIGGLLAGFFIPLAFGAVAAFLLWKRQARKWNGTAAEAVMPEVCEFLGDLSYDYEAHKGFPLERMQKAWRDPVPHTLGNQRPPGRHLPRNAV
ncbi:hypothetical protein QW131_06815 [Roseibium salinum]|nr:hypothetical protein [Roseibium salinum]